MSNMQELIFKTLTNETPNIILIKDYSGKFIYGNKMLAQLYKTTPENLIGKSDSDFNPNKEQTDFYLKNIQEIMEKNEAEVVIESSTNSNNNEISHYHSVKKPFFDENGNKNILVIANDITDIQNSKKEIEKKEHRLDIALEIIGEGVWDWDIKDNIVSHNRKWCEMVGADESKLSHELDFFVSLIDKEDRDKVFEKIQAALESKKTYTSEHRLVCLDGSVKWVRDRGEIVEYDDLGNPSRMIGSVKDITDTILLRKKEQLLEQQSRLASLGEMIGNISHQWRQPLSMISSISSGVKLQDTLGAMNSSILNESMDDISKQVSYLSKTIDDFKNFIKNDKKRKDYNILESIETCLTIVKSSISNNYITLEKELLVIATCSGFEGEILQAMINILNNAKDVLVENIENHDDRLIFIATSKNEKSIFISIKDSAGGIPQDIIEDIFNPYFTTKDKDGTGLGLYMSKKIIEETNHGSITVKNVDFTFNKKEYKGAEFIIQLPLEESFTL